MCGRRPLKPRGSACLYLICVCLYFPDSGVVYSYSSRAAEARRVLVYNYIRDPRLCRFYGGIV